MLSPPSNSEPIAITGIGPMCSVATSASELLALGQRSSHSPVVAGTEWFDPERYLGQRKYKYLTKATRYALAAAAVAIEDAGIGENTYPPEQRGAILGTNFAVCGVHDLMDKVILSEGAMGLSPMEAANFSVNLAASHISLRHGFRAFNVCLTSSFVAGIEAVAIAAHAVRQGRCAMALAGATEDRPPAAVNRFINSSVENGAACALVLETERSALERSARSYAIVGNAALWFAHPELAESSAGRERLAHATRQKLDHLLAFDQGFVFYCPLELPTLLSGVLDELVTDELRRRSIKTSRESLLGADGAFITVSPMLQMAAGALHNLDSLIVATSPEGHVAMLTLYKVTPGSRQPLSAGQSPQTNDYCNSKMPAPEIAVTRESTEPEEQEHEH